MHQDVWRTRMKSEEMILQPGDMIRMGRQTWVCISASDTLIYWLHRHRLGCCSSGGSVAGYTKRLVDVGYDIVRDDQ